jgi:hypothetical protein
MRRSAIGGHGGARASSDALVADLSQIPGEVAELITDGVFHGASGVLTSVASHYLTLDLGAAGKGPSRQVVHRPVL